MKSKYKEIKKCPCGKKYEDMDCKSEYLVYGKWVCSDCYLKVIDNEE